MLLCEQKAIYFYLSLRTVMQFKCCFSYRFFQSGDILMNFLRTKETPQNSFMSTPNYLLAYRLIILLYKYVELPNI
jgi:hypothetical protein